MRAIKSKKGAIAISIADFWSYLIFALLLIVLYPFFDYQGREINANRIRSIKDTSINADLQLLSFLRTPYRIDGRDQTIADLIVHYHNEKNYNKKKEYRDDISKKINEIFRAWEHCEKLEGVSGKPVLFGYSVIVLDGESYKYFKKSNDINSIKDEKKFGRLHISDNFVKSLSFAILANQIFDDPIYVGFFEGFDFLEDNTGDIPGCT